MKYEITAGKCPIEVGGNCPLRPQGEWIYTDNRWGLGAWECDKCHKYTNKNTDFCPNCGAKMVSSEKTQEV